MTDGSKTGFPTMDGRDTIDTAAILRRIACKGDRSARVQTRSRVAIRSFPANDEQFDFAAVL